MVSSSIEVAFDQRRRGDHRERMTAFLQHLENLAGDTQSALDGLPAIGIDAQRDGTAATAWPRQFGPQQPGGDRLAEQAGLEVQTRRQAQARMRGVDKAVDAAMLAAAVGIDGLLEGYVRRRIAGDDGAGRIDADLCGMRAGKLVLLLARPAVVDRDLPAGVEAGSVVADGPAPFFAWNGISSTMIHA